MPYIKTKKKCKGKIRRQIITKKRENLHLIILVQGEKYEQAHEVIRQAIQKNNRLSDTKISYEMIPSYSKE